MASTTVLLKTPKVLKIGAPSQPGCNSNPLADSVLRWRLNKLVVTAGIHRPGMVTPALQNLQWLADCLTHSRVKAVCLDVDLGEAALLGWADLCHAARKHAVLRLPHLPHLPSQRYPVAWAIKRLADWVAALLLLLLFSPVGLVIALLLWLRSPGSIVVSEWCVGYRGQLFRSIKFRASRSAEQAHRLRDRWRGLPQLVNVLRGEMSLIGVAPAPTLSAAAQLAPELRCHLNALPGLLNAAPIEASLSQPFKAEWQPGDWLSGKQWSLLHDAKLLLWSLPRLVFNLSTD